eukprot:TRINITY_DN13375_c0_g1_i1.p2 TRINITY_DN13375_c0_g1~~TRINITY_DN13375_c0_g1_i1.p2  ORF type:complete len:115 (+),score=17.13 TRINITY_DN13375_c0_g1_i1:70-414(+)
MCIRDSLIALTVACNLNLLPGIEWKCRISSDFAGTHNFLVSADVMDDHTLTCTSPDVSGSIAYTDTTSYVHYYISVSQYDQTIVNDITRPMLSLIHICRCRRYAVCRSRWSPYH